MVCIIEASHQIIPQYFEQLTKQFYTQTLIYIKQHTFGILVLYLHDICKC